MQRMPKVNFPPPETIVEHVFQRYCSAVQKKFYPFQFFLIIRPSVKSIGFVSIAVRQILPRGNIQLWSSVCSMFLKSEGPEYFDFREPKYRALVRLVDVKDDKHLAEWFGKAVGRVYRSRVNDLLAIEGQNLRLQEWIDEMDSSSFEFSF